LSDGRNEISADATDFKVAPPQDVKAPVVAPDILLQTRTPTLTPTPPPLATSHAADIRSQPIRLPVSPPPTTPDNRPAETGSLSGKESDEQAAIFDYNEASASSSQTSLASTLRSRRGRHSPHLRGRSDEIEGSRWVS
jgi:hypothetical protein